MSAFGTAAKQKLHNVSAAGEPEDQLRAPFETLLGDLAEVANLDRNKVTAVGESSLRDLKTRPDYAVTVHHALVGFVELKSPGKGADPRKFRDPHDKAQWQKLRSLPDVLYTDGNEFSRWESGELKELVRLSGDVENSGDKLAAPAAATAANPAFTARFQDDLSTPGLRIPLTADAATFAEAVELGRTVLWLHTFGERFANPAEGRPAQPPRLPETKRPRIPADGAIPDSPDAMPDTIDYDPAAKRLRLGAGYVENVEPAVWHYEVSGKQALLQWFSYRKKNRDRPIIGDRRPPSPLGNIQPDHWLAEYTTELINVLNVLGWLVDLEPQQAALLEKICTGPTITAEELRATAPLRYREESRRKQRRRRRSQTSSRSKPSFSRAALRPSRARIPPVGQPPRFLPCHPSPLSSATMSSF